MNNEYLIDIAIALFVLFLPGFSLAFALLDLENNEILERIALAVPLSISTIPLFAFTLNIFGIPINKQTVIIETIIISLIGILGYLYRKKKRNK